MEPFDYGDVHLKPGLFRHRFNVNRQYLYSLSTGMLGTNALVQALPRCGRADVMYHIATQTTFPSWGYMVSKGATTLWESWDGNPEEQLSYNMKLFGSIDKYFYKHLAGISPASPGYKRITVKPHVVGDLTSARASIKIVRGLAAVDWRKDLDLSPCK